MQAKHQEHLRRPAAESLDRDEAFDDGLVGQHIELIEEKAAIDDAGTQIAQVADLLPAEPGASERGVAQLVDACGREAHLAGNQGLNTLKDRRRGLRRQLLTDDGTDERRQMVVPLARGHAAGPDPFDGGAEDGIAAHEQPPRAGVVGRSQGMVSGMKRASESASHTRL
jgi:hypothetical protein